MTTIPPQQGQPYGPGPGYGAPVPAQPPAPLSKAVMFMWAGAAFTVIGAVIGLFQVPSVTDQVNSQMPQADARMMQGFMAGGIVMGLVFALIIAGLWAWMAIMNKKGRSWARITATVFGGINLLMLIPSLIGVMFAPMMGAADTNMLWSVVQTVIQLVIVIGALVFLWNRQNNPYYEAMSRR